MPNPNAIVATIRRLDPPLDRPPAELLRRAEGIAVELADGRRVRLDPADDRSAGFAPILDALSRQKALVYLEVEPATSFVTRVLLPHVTRVVGVHASDAGLDVEVELSHARHVLRREAADFTEFENRLRDSLRTGGVITMTEDDAHNIIDIRGFTPDPDNPIPRMPPFPRPQPPRWPWPIRWLRDLLRPIWYWCWWPWWWFRWRCVSRTRAQDIFDAMAATSCNPLTVPAPCIPFMYPDDGCWARAHEMCRLMVALGVSPRKVWIERGAPGLLHVDTRNNPNCFVEWYWHVAPTICVRRWFFCWGVEMVIDPSMFTMPVSKTTWKNAQNNANATLTDTSWTIYYLWGSVTDPTFSETNFYLAKYRTELQLRSLGPSGPPPYAHCP